MRYDYLDTNDTCPYNVDATNMPTNEPSDPTAYATNSLSNSPTTIPTETLYTQPTVVPTQSVTDKPTLMPIYITTITRVTSTSSTTGTSVPKSSPTNYLSISTSLAQRANLSLNVTQNSLDPLPYSTRTTFLLKNRM